MRNANFLLNRFKGGNADTRRASFADRLPDHIIAERNGFSLGYLRVFSHQFRHEKIDFSEPLADDSRPRRRMEAATRQKIVQWRPFLAGDIVQLFKQVGVDISAPITERILAEEGFTKLLRRTQLKINRTV